MNALLIKSREHRKYFPGRKRINEISQSSEQFRLDMNSRKVNMMRALERFLWRMMTLSLSHEVFLKHFRWLVKIEEILFYPKLFWDRPKGSKHFGFESGDFIAAEPKIFLKSRIADRTAFFFQFVIADCTVASRRLHSKIHGSPFALLVFLLLC